MEGFGLAVLNILGQAVFILSLLVGVVMSAVTLPGSLLVLASAIVFSACTHWQRPGWQVLIGLAVLATIAELLDSILTMYGVRKYGGSRRSAVLGGVGALVGAIVGGWVIPVPIVGSLVGALAGGFATAWWLETRSGREHREAVRAGWGSVMGRAMGATAKVILTIAMVVVTVVAVYSG